jgi:cytochrome c oxidase cbb3-type subunit 3
MRLILAASATLAIAIAQQQPGTFPAMQRPPADPQIVARGKTIFGANCVPCHGADARGGQLNGPNLLRSQLVLGDRDGESIGPVIQNGRPERGMPAFPLPAEDIKALVEFLHSLTAASPGQGAPPRAEAPPPNIVVGDAAAGQAYFTAKCSPCHSAEGDLTGIATRVSDAKALQNLWVSGGETGRGGRGRGRGGDDPSAPAVTATVTARSGEKVSGRLVYIDDFEIKVVTEDGSLRTFARDDDVPRVEIKDPLQGHKELLSALTDKDMRNVTAYLVTLK